MSSLRVEPAPAVVQISDEGIVLENRGWYPLLAFVRRATDEQVVLEVRSWGGGTGDAPATGWITADGTITQDVAEAAPFPTSDLVVQVRGEGTAKGRQIATMAIVDGTAIGATQADWSDVLTGYSAANGLPGDTDAQLRIPRDLPESQWGFLFEANQPQLGADREYTPLYVTASDYGDHTLQLANGGEALLIRYERAPGGFSGDGDRFIVRVLGGDDQEAIDDDVMLTVSEAIIGAGAGGLDQAAVDSRVAALVENYAEAGKTATIPLARFGDGVITLVKLAQEVRDAISAGGGGGGGLSTEQVNSLIAGAVENFAEVASAATIPATRLGANTVGSDKLTQAVRDAIAAGGGGLSTSQVNTLIANAVENFAETGSLATIPAARIGANTIASDKLTQAVRNDLASRQTLAQVNTRIAAVVEDYAEVGNTATIPASRFGADTISLDKLTAAVRTAIADRGTGGITTAAARTLIGTLVGSELNNVADAMLDLLLVREDVTATNITVQQNIPVVIAGSELTGNGVGVLEHRDYDPIIIDYNEVLAVQVGAAGTALAGDAHIEFTLKDHGVASAVTVRVGRTSANSALVSYSVAGSYNGVVLRDLAARVIPSTDVLAAATLPGVSDRAVGDIFNLSGVLYVLRDDEEHRLQVTSIGTTGRYMGARKRAGLSDVGAFSDPALTGFEYLTYDNEAVPRGTAPATLAIPKAQFQTAPTNVYATVITSTGEELLLQVFNRASANDGTDAWAYAADTVHLDPSQLGTSISISLYSNATRTMPLDLHSVARWELLAVAGTRGPKGDKGDKGDPGDAGTGGVSGSLPPISEYDTSATATITNTSRTANVVTTTTTFGDGWTEVIDAGQARLRADIDWAGRANASGDFSISLQPKDASDANVGGVISVPFEIMSTAGATGTVNARVPVGLPVGARGVQVVAFVGSAATWSAGGTVMLTVDALTLYHDTVEDVLVTAATLSVTGVDGFARNFGRVTPTAVDERVRTLLGDTPPDGTSLALASIPAGGPGGTPNVSFQANRTTGVSVLSDTTDTVNPKSEIVVRYQLTADDAPATETLFDVSLTMSLILEDIASEPNSRANLMAQVERVRGGVTTPLFRTNNGYVRDDPAQRTAPNALGVLFLNADLTGTRPGVGLMRGDIVQVNIFSYGQVSARQYNLYTPGVNRLIIQQMGRAGPAGPRGPMAAIATTEVFRNDIGIDLANRWAATGYVLPTDPTVEWLLIDEGSRSAAAIPRAEWSWVRVEDIRALPASTVNTTATAMTASNTHTGMLIGRDSGDQVLISSQFAIDYVGWSVREVRPEALAEPSESTYAATLAAATADLDTRTVALAAASVDADHELTLANNAITFGVGGEYSVAVNLNLETIGGGTGGTSRTWVAIIVERTRGAGTVNLLKDAVEIPQTSDATGTQTGPGTIDYGSEVAGVFADGDVLRVKAEVVQRRLTTAQFRINSGTVRIVNTVGRAQGLPGGLPPVGELTATGQATVAYANRASMVAFQSAAAVRLNDAWNPIVNRRQARLEAKARITGRTGVTGDVDVSFNCLDGAGNAVGSVTVNMVLPDEAAGDTDGLASTTLPVGTVSVVPVEIASSTATWTSSGTFTLAVTDIIIYEELVEDVSYNAGTGEITTTWNTDRTDSFTVAPSASIPSGTMFPASPSVGDRFILLHDESVPDDRVLRMVQTSSTTRQLRFGAGAGLPSFVIAYSATHANPALRNRVAVAYGGARSKTASRLFLYPEHDAQVSYAVSATPLTAAGTHFYEVTGLAGLYDSLPVGDYHANVLFTDNTKLYADIQFALGDYSYEGAEDGWVLTPGVAAPWATQGQPEPRTLLGVTRLVDGPAQGVTVSDTAVVRREPLTLFSPTFDLDDPDKSAGVLQVEATVRISTRSSTSIVFESGTTTHRMVGFAFASTLNAVANRWSGTADNGLLIGDVEVRGSGATVYGTISLRLAINANNEAGYYLIYTPDASAAAGNFSIGMSMEAVFIHNDGAASGASTFTGLTDTPTSYTDQAGSVPVVNAGANALVLQSVAQALGFRVRYGSIVQQIALTANPSFQVRNGFQRLTRNSAGSYTIEFDDRLANTSYVVIASRQGRAPEYIYNDLKNTDSFRLICRNTRDGANVDLPLGTGIQFVVISPL